MASDNLESNLLLARIASDSVITELNPELSLEEIAAMIVVLAHEEDDVVLQNAIYVTELKRRILAGKAGRGVKWMEWMLKHVDMCKSHLYALVEIGSDDNPPKALERWRRRARERSKRRVISKDMSENHRNMIKLVCKLTDYEAKQEYLALWQRYPDRI